MVFMIVSKALSQEFFQWWYTTYRFWPSVVTLGLPILGHGTIWGRICGKGWCAEMNTLEPLWDFEHIFTVFLTKWIQLQSYTIVYLTEWIQNQCSHDFLSREYYWVVWPVWLFIAQTTNEDIARFKFYWSSKFWSDLN